MSRKQVAVIDYGMGNLHSVASALHCVAPDVDVLITADAERIAAADHVIFPGVGAIRDCMAEILAQGVDRVVADTILSSKPLLAICVGMQALMQTSSENAGVACLAQLPGVVENFADSAQFAAVKPRLKVPHMGWNQVAQTQGHPLWHGIEDHSRFYFVHSYYVQLSAQPDVGGLSLEAGRCHYGRDFTAAIARDNVFAVQFHPEKSHADGLKLLQNFVNWDGC